MSNVGKLDIMVNNNKKGDEARRTLLRYWTCQFIYACINCILLCSNLNILRMYSRSSKLSNENVIKFMKEGEFFTYACSPLSRLISLVPITSLTGRLFDDAVYILISELSSNLPRDLVNASSFARSLQRIGMTADDRADCWIETCLYLCNPLNRKRSEQWPASSGRLDNTICTRWNWHFLDKI